MKRGALWRISVPVTPATEDAVSELLALTLGEIASVYEDARTGRASASVYLEDAARWTEDTRARLEAGLFLLVRSGLASSRPRLGVTRLRREDWAESWKRHFQPMEFGRALLVKPSWSRRRPRPGQAVVVLDPGLSFGTGQHPTTRFCLEQIVARRRADTVQSFLDIGTGSGILAIAAAKLGYRPVEAFDFDADAVRIARANARQNSLSPRRLHPRCLDLTALPEKSVQKFDMVCANLMADLLIGERDRIVQRLRPGGMLVLAGILAGQFSGVTQAYAKAGLRLAARRREMEWKSGAFVWR